GGEAEANPQVLAVAVATLSAALLLTTLAIADCGSRIADWKIKKTAPAPLAFQSAIHNPQSAIGRLWRRLAVAAVWVGTGAVIAAGIVGPLQANVLCCAGERLLNTRPRDAVQAVACAA